MSTFKIGDAVRLTQLGKSWDATIVAMDDRGRGRFSKWSHGYEGACFWGQGEAGLTITKKENDMDNLQVGDVIVRDEQEYGIIGVFGQVVLSVDITGVSGRESVDVDTIPGLKSNGWRVKGEEPEVKELTIAEIAERLNVPVDQLRIKD